MYQVSYEYYSSSYGGETISEEEFKGVSRKAGYIVDSMTFNRFSKLNADELSEDMLERVNDCLCAVADMVYNNSENGVMETRAVASESVANWSVSYGSSGSSGSGSSVMSGIKSLVDMYLGGTYLTCAWC